MLTRDEMFMQEALRQARMASEADEVPVGAVIIHEGTLIAKAHNQVELLKDPTAHAEMIALTQAANARGGKWLEDCTLYVTLEPCAMCAGAIVLARVGRVVYGARDPKAGACGSVLDVLPNEKLNHQPEIVQGIFADACGGMLTEFFQRKRKTGKK